MLMWSIFLYFAFYYTSILPFCRNRKQWKTWTDKCWTNKQEAKLKFFQFFSQVFIRLFFVQTDNFIAFWFDSCNVQSQKNKNIQICLELLLSHLKELLNSTTEIMLFPKMLVLLFFHCETV